MLHLLQAMTVRQPAESAFLVCGNGESIIQISRLERPEVMCFFFLKIFLFFFLPSFSSSSNRPISPNKFFCRNPVCTTDSSGVAQVEWGLGPCLPFRLFSSSSHGPPSTIQVSAQDSYM